METASLIIGFMVGLITGLLLLLLTIIPIKRSVNAQVQQLKKVSEFITDNEKEV